MNRKALVRTIDCSLSSESMVRVQTSVNRSDTYRLGFSKGLGVSLSSLYVDPVDLLSPQAVTSVSGGIRPQVTGRMRDYKTQCWHAPVEGF